jgi:hypothetical protein
MQRSPSLSERALAVVLYSEDKRHQVSVFSEPSIDGCRKHLPHLILSLRDLTPSQVKRILDFQSMLMRGMDRKAARERILMLVGAALEKP